MLTTLEPLLKHLPPKTHGALLDAINKCASKLDMPANWVQRWLGFSLVADALARSVVNDEPVFELKGGAAIELRLRQAESTLKPRATKDLDATYRGTLEEIRTAVVSALAAVSGDFTYRLIDDDERPEHMRRFYVAVSYKGKSLSKVKLEVSPYEGVHRAPEQVTAPDLSGFGLTTLETFTCLPLTKQIAQKIHAVTEVFLDKENDRYRDLIDLTLLSTLRPASADLREVCEETFSVRGKHGWPPSVAAPASWREPMERMASELGLSQQDADAIIAHVQQYVVDIAHAT